MLNETAPLACVLESFSNGARLRFSQRYFAAKLWPANSLRRFQRESPDFRTARESSVHAENYETFSRQS
jgi:hypothetical protein